MAVRTYRKANVADAAALSKLRGSEAGTCALWEKRIAGYLRREHHPQKALNERVIFLAEHRDGIIGFVAGHLTERYECDGELQWIDVMPEYRRNGIASQLLRRLAEWFGNKKALRVCVDVSPDNVAGQGFYRRHGAKELNRHWLVWPDIRVVTTAAKHR